jgi:hypothetical protein
VRKVHLIGALVGVLALVMAAVAVASPQFTQNATTKLTKAKVKASTGVSVDFRATDPGEPGGKPKRASKIVIKLAPGTRVSTKAVKQCNLTRDEDIVEGKCPKASLVGTGLAKANVAPLIPSTTEDVKAYASKSGLILLLTDNKEDTNTGSTIVLRAKISKFGVITVKVPELQPLPGVFAVLTDFTLKTKPKSKGRGAKRVNLITAPTKCTKKGWTNTVTFSYADGSAKDVRKTKQSCRK